MEADLLITNGIIVTETQEAKLDIAVRNGKIIAIGEIGKPPPNAEVLDADGMTVLPGLVDPHVHFREPGPTEEEDFFTGSRAAAAGGITTVIEQPVDTPPTTTLERFLEKVDLVNGRSYVDYGLWAGVVPGNLNELQSLKEAGAWAFKAFVCSSDPLYPMINDGDLLDAMEEISRLDSILAIHAENQFIIETYAARLNAAETVRPIDHARYRPPVAELEAIHRMIFLAKYSGVRLHILHLSVAEGADLVAEARQNGQVVTVETCPHYLVIDEQALEKYGPYAKCNPPLRSKENQEKLWEALLQGKIDCIVSDHSPYTTVDKNRGHEDIRLSPPGINSLELGLPLLISEAVNPGKISMSQLANWMASAPAKLFGLYPRKGSIRIGADADFVFVDKEREWTVDAEKLETKNKWSPFNGWNVKGKVIRTMVRGKTVYLEDEFPQGPGFGELLLPDKL
jgi:allantoinase